MLKLSLAILSVLFVCSQAEYNKLQWSLCHTATQTPAIKVYEMDLSPMPVVHPGTHNIRLRAESSRAINGPLKGSLNIVRTVAGIFLPIRCYLVQGVYVGSCTYNDLCSLLKDIANKTPDNCPPEALPYGVDCSCPFNIPAQSVDVTETVDIPDLSTTVVNFLALGDFDITVKADTSAGFFGCLNIKLSVKKAAL